MPSTNPSKASYGRRRAGFGRAWIAPALVCLLASPIGPLPGNAAEAHPEIAGSPDRPEYVLHPFDKIQVVVFQEPDLEREVRLSQDSTISLPLIGTVRLRGRTVREAQAIIRDLYNRDYLVNPQINVSVIEYTKVTINVLGSVDRPGPIQIPPNQPLGLVDAISQAGGFSRLADRKHVKLTRTEADGKTTTTVINADQLLQDASADKWVLQKDDVIYVPERIL